MTTVHPAASASAILRAGKISGMFQGQAAKTGPMGSLSTVCLVAGKREGIVRP